MESGNEALLDSETDVHPVNETNINTESSLQSFTNVDDTETHSSSKKGMESGNEALLDSETDIHPVNEVMNNTESSNQSFTNVDDSETHTSSKRLGKLAKISPHSSTFGRSPRPILSPSLSFPSKTRTPDLTKPASSNSASSRLHANRSSSGLKVIKTVVLDKEDDDASSTASPNVRRNSTSGFHSRLDERAERRKQFNSKIEEKVHAKEAEKTNLQAKSKENQEKEIKKLRKSLTFKARPLPNFYKEPPPKPIIKKIPTTQPVSPKLGRNKSSVGAVVKVLEHIETGHSPRAIRGQTMSPRFNPTNRDKNTAAFKQPTRKSLTKTSEVKATNSKEPVQESLVIVVGSHEDEGFLEVDTVKENGNGSSSSSTNQDMTSVAVDIVV